ncbi:MAG TPA: acetate--CoA ligase family protein [Burkholderiales bacterium]|nr:acetate--CoA ligase family protein [Burkholderiales bacterium]
MTDLSFLLAPRSIAILGASDDFSKVNGRTVKYLLAKGYAGSIYPVNPKYERIGELPCYPAVDALPEPPDLAVVGLPATLVVQAVSDLGRRGVKSAIVFSSGFAEIGEAGRALEQQVVAAAKAAGVRLCGPNCLGLINAFSNVMATFGQFAEGDTPPGPVAFVTQSGAFGTAIAALARRRGMGLGYFVNTGNEGDIDFVEIMDAVLHDERIKVGAGYIEGLKDGARFREMAERALALGKPLVVTKVGRTQAGARAAVSHTGSLAGADEVFSGVVHGLGVLRARNEEQMLDMVEAFAHCALPQGKGLGILTQSGGAGVLMADHAEDCGLSVPVLSKTTQNALRKVMPPFGASGNPVDITGQFIAEPGLLERAFRIVLSDPDVHIGIVWLQLMEGYVDVLVGIFERLKAQSEKPFLVCWVAAPDGAAKALRESGIPVLRGAEPAVDAAGALARYARARRDWLADSEARAALRHTCVHAPLERAASGPVPTVIAASWLDKWGVATAPIRLAHTAEEAVLASGDLGYPVAVKIESPDIPHKTDAGGVKLMLQDAESVRQAYGEVLSDVRRLQPSARIEGVVVQRMAKPGVELVVGLKRDPVFGMLIMVGLGGIHIEILKDVAFRAAPVTQHEAGQMLAELRGSAVLEGARGQPPADRRALCRFISAVSAFGAAAGKQLRELDLNPVFATAEGVVAVDWLLVVE